MFADDLQITFRRIPDQLPDQVADEVYCVDLHVGRHLSTDETDAVTKELLWIPYVATGNGDCILLSETRGIYEWGGSGTGWTYLVELASHLDEVAIGIAITKAIDKITDTIGTRSREQCELDRDSAVHSAGLGVLKMNTQLAREMLTPVSEEHDRETGKWSFSFRPGDGWEYVADVGMLGTLPGVTRVKRFKID